MQQTKFAGTTLFPPTKPALLQTVTTKTPITADVWQAVMEQHNKINQDNKLSKKPYKKKV